MHPILFEIGPLTIRSYGVLVGVGFFVSSLLFWREAKKINFFPDKIPDLMFFVLVSGIIGARVLHVAVNTAYYGENLLEIFFIWRGGLAIYGGIIFGFIAGWIFAAKNKIPFLQGADLFVPYMALGQAIGRIGCFLNGCCYGKPVVGNVSAIIFPGEIIARYPTQIYASFSLFMVFMILKLLREKRFPDGTMFFLYLAFYSVQRFFIDFFRADTPAYIFNLTVSQIISVIVFAIATWKIRGKCRRSA